MVINPRSNWPAELLDQSRKASGSILHVSFVTVLPGYITKPPVAFITVRISKRKQADQSLSGKSSTTALLSGICIVILSVPT